MRARVTAIVVALQLSATSARADETEAAAQLHLDRGVAAFDAADYPGAHHEFEEAHELAPDRPNPYRWLALTEVQLGDCPAALAHIQEFLARVPQDDPRIAELVRLGGLCERQVAAPAPAPAPSPRRPITHRWWFWTAVVGGAAAIAGTIALIASDDGGPTTLPPIHCGDAGCAP